MAQLTFDGLQPVGFGGRDCTPKINAEQRLRLQGLKLDTESDAREADKVLASCFPEDEGYVREFLGEQMAPFEKQQLRAYLIAGPGGIRIIDESITNAINGAIEEGK